MLVLACSSPSCWDCFPLFSFLGASGCNLHDVDIWDDLFSDIRESYSSKLFWDAFLASA